MNNSNYKGHLAILSANIIFGLFSPISKTLLASGCLNTYTLTTLRMFGAALVFWIASFFTKYEKVTPFDMVLLFLASLFGIVFNQAFFMIGLSMTSPVNATIVATTTPILTMLIAALYLKEPISGKKIIGILMGASGALLLILTSHGVSANATGNIYGDLFCLLAQVCFATYLVLFKKLIGRYTPVTLMKWMFIYASLCCIPFGYQDFTTLDFNSFTWLEILKITYIILFATFLAYLLISISQKQLRPTVISTYAYVQPLVAAIVAVLLGQDTFGWIKGTAIALVFAGVYIVTRSKSRQQLEQEKQGSAEKKC